MSDGRFSYCGVATCRLQAWIIFKFSFIVFGQHWAPHVETGVQTCLIEASSHVESVSRSEPLTQRYWTRRIACQQVSTRRTSRLLDDDDHSACQLLSGTTQCFF